MLTLVKPYTSENLVLNNLFSAHLFQQLHAVKVWQLVLTAFKPVVEHAADVVFIG